ncbi:Metallopeptidase M24 family protein [Striga hermonthica]|uniref:Metallopeptidase M24 family protein n=1 Tax=Striga hermonthica TaxID=68872 RepID=A0A9N7R7Q8_STRHE|nr:Metallopeptidase M24 family protein [Striga hermonthica]
MESAVRYSAARMLSLSTANLRARSRAFSILTVPSPFSRNITCLPKFPTKLHCHPRLRLSASITAKPSSELQKKRGSSEPDEKLVALRELFSRPNINIDAYIIPSQDAHQSEFIADCYARRAYISGFTGSAGTAVVTKNKAALWTDGRYFLQAEQQLNSSWILMRAGNLGVPSTSEWLNGVMAPGSRIGIDPFLFSSDAAEKLKEAISTKNHELVYLYDVNLVDEIWKDSRPKHPNSHIRLHDLKYAGVDVSSKLSSLRSELANAGSSAIVITMLDEIAWLLNLRGSDVPHSPVMYAYLVVEIDGAKLFIDDVKVKPDVMHYLEAAGIELRPYDSILSHIGSLAAKGACLWLDTSSVSAAIVNTYKSACEKHFGTAGTVDQSKETLSASHDGHSCGPTAICKSSPISLAKAVKNEAELQGMCDSHLRDAAALAQFWVWLEEEISRGVILTEVDVADKLLEFRSRQDGFLDTSFDTISGSGANGAIIHYRADPSNCSIVDAEKLFLLDSGAQYIDGTTDITRTVHFGQPSSWQKECFTRVLQGHIALDQAVFPENYPGFVLDAFARSSLWKIGLDYRHGTGHGVGAALNVHEGPQSISFRFSNMTPLLKGMVVSNEPGYYEDHAFGIRIENLLYVKEINTPNRFGGVDYLGFEKLTFVPIQEHYELPDKEKLRKRVFSRAGDGWRAFKTKLSREYIFGEKIGLLPYDDGYPFLDADTWKAFVASRQTPEFLYLDPTGASKKRRASGTFEGQRDDPIQPPPGQPARPVPSSVSFQDLLTKNRPHVTLAPLAEGEPATDSITIVMNGRSGKILFSDPSWDSLLHEWKHVVVDGRCSAKQESRRRRVAIAAPSNRTGTVDGSTKENTTIHQATAPA